MEEFKPFDLDGPVESFRPPPPPPRAEEHRTAAPALEAEEPRRPWYDQETTVRSSGPPYLLYYILCVLVPPFGILLGTVLRTSPDKEDRDQAAEVLQLGAIMMFVMPILLATLFGLWVAVVD